MGQMIRDQVAYDRARTKKQAAFDRRVDTVRSLLEGVLRKSNGIVAGANEEEVYARLLSDGVLGGKSRQIAGAVKMSRHAGLVLSNDDSYRLRSAFNVIKTAITAAVDDAETAIDMSFDVKYVAVHLTDYSDMQLDERDGALDTYDRYHPVQYRLPGGTIQRVGCYFDE